MSSRPGTTTDFSARLQAALGTAKGQRTKTAAPPSTPTDSAPVDDEFNQRLNAAMGRARGESQLGAAETAPDAGGPVGDGDYVVRDGECISSIAKKHGFFWETLWNDPANAQLKESRRNPNVLLPGDRLTVLEKRRKDESLAPEQRHRFRRKGEPSKIRFQLLRGPSTLLFDSDDRQQESEDQPWANVPFTVVIDDEQFEGVSDSAGYIECRIPGNAKKGELIINPGQPDERVIQLILGALSPVSELAGVVERLENLGFQCGEDDPQELTSDLRSALSLFQDQNKLPASGEPDEATRTKLVQVHGS